MAAAKTSPTQQSAQATQAGASRGAQQQGSASTGAAASPAPRIPAVHQPTPAQQNPQPRGTLRPSAAHAPTAQGTTPTSAANPEREFRQRLNSALDTRGAQRERAPVESAGEDAPPPPKAKTTGSAPGTAPSKQTESSSPDSPEPKTPASPDPASTAAPKDSDEPETTSAEPSGEATQGSKRGPRYELKAFQKWALENPDQAREFFQDVGKHVFKEGKEINGEWVALTNKTRKRLKQIDERHAQTMAEQTRVRDENAGHLKQIETHVQQIRPVLTMWQGAQRKDDKGNHMPDFDAVDAAFFQTTQGMTVDDYMRLRARRGIVDPRTAQLRAENAALKQQLQAGAPQAQAPAQTNGAGGAAKAVAKAETPPAPAAPAEDLKAKWNGEIPKGHKLRQFDGWEKLLDDAMDQYDDGMGGYDEDPEAIADRVAKKQLEALAADFEEFEEPAPKPKAKPKPKAPAQPPPRRASAPTNGRGVPSAAELTPRGHKVGHEPHDPANPLDWARRQDWAIQRAQARARGEAVD